MTASRLAIDGLVPLLLLLAVIEWLVLRRRANAAYDWRESLASLGVAAGHRAAGGVALLVLRPVFEGLWSHRLATVPLDRPWALALLFCGVELAYYAQHRLSHSVRWLWASHAVHHTSTQITVSAGYRLAWTDLVSGTPFFVAPLVVVGFAPSAVLVTVAIVVAYQFWLHTELVPAMPWFDRVFNSPANHRVHHVAAAHGGANFGGVLVVFDRLFGTYAAERPGEPREYGLVVPLVSYDPLEIAFHEWAGMWRDVRASRTWGEAVGACLTVRSARRGWSRAGGRPSGEGT